MFITILVLLGLAGAIWYFARTQTQTVTLSQGDIAASNPSIEESEAKLKEAQLTALEINSRLEKMTEKIEDVTRLKVELEYIKLQVQKNSDKLDTILEKVK